MREKYSNLKKNFEKKYGCSPEIIVRAPGRVNLIGEHIDYNGGVVLPVGICSEVALAVKMRNDKKCRMMSTQFEDEYYEGSIPSSKIEHPFWVNYFFGVYDEINKIQELKNGFDILVDSDVPRGSGLSSSAAIEVAMGTALSSLYNISMSKIDLALLCQRAENKFVGVNCGLMDQAASACSTSGHALLLDCAKPDFTQIPLSDSDDVNILIAHCGVHRKLSTSEYNKRRSECDQALKIINESLSSDYRNLCEINQETFDKVKTNLSGSILKRARHAISEQQRVMDVCEALKTSDFDKVGALLNQSHFSLKNDFEVSCRELDELTELLRNTDGVYGSRLTGAGFGGCTISLVEKKKCDEIIDIVNIEFYEKKRYESLIFETKAENGAEVIAKF